MSETHHHHHHHKMDDASRYKYRTLSQMKLRKRIYKFTKITLVVVAILMAIAVIVVYLID